MHFLQQTGGRNRKHHGMVAALREAVSWPALFILLALILGGGTFPGLSSDFILQTLALPLLYRLVLTFPAGAPRTLQILAAGILLLFLWQLVPVWGERGIYFPNTLDAGRTLQAFLVLLVPVSLYWSIIHLERVQREALPWWFLAGLFINLLVAFMQFSAPHVMDALQPFSWKMNAGLFANENHLASLVVVGIPIIVALFCRTRWPLASLLVLLPIILFEMVIGSRAGVAFSLLAALFALAYIYANAPRAALFIAALVALAGVYLLMQGELDFSKDFAVGEGELTRGVFFENTLRAIRDHLPFGTGFETFTLVYPSYELETGIRHVYVNHAHNDWLEVALEGGLPALALLAVFLIWLFSLPFRFALSPMQRASLLGILFLLLHSVVDYPLRTLALASSFAMFAAFLSRENEKQMRNKNI